MKKALEKFKTAKLLDEKLRKDLIFDTGYRYSSHSLEKLPQVFVKNINTIIDFLEKVKDSHKWNMEKAGYILGWQLDESPDSDKKGKPPNNTTVLGRDNVPRYTIERKEYIGTVELTQKLEKLFVDVFIQRKKRLKK